MDYGFEDVDRHGSSTLQVNRYDLPGFLDDKAFRFTDGIVRGLLMLGNIQDNQSLGIQSYLLFCRFGLSWIPKKGGCQTPGIMIIVSGHRLTYSPDQT